IKSEVHIMQELFSCLASRCMMDNRRSLLHRLWSCFLSFSLAGLPLLIFLEEASACRVEVIQGKFRQKKADLPLYEHEDKCSYSVHAQEEQHGCQSFSGCHCEIDKRQTPECQLAHHLGPIGIGWVIEYGHLVANMATEEDPSPS